MTHVAYMTYVAFATCISQTFERNIVVDMYCKESEKEPRMLCMVKMGARVRTYASVMGTQFLPLNLQI